MGVEDGEEMQGFGFPGGDGGRVEGVGADEGAEPADHGLEDVGVNEGHPAQDGGVVAGGGAEEGGGFVLGCYWRWEEGGG